MRQHRMTQLKQGIVYKYIDLPLLGVWAKGAGNYRGLHHNSSHNKFPDEV